MAASPLANTEGALRVQVFSNGTDVTELAPIVSATVRRAFNRVPGAQLVFADGDMPKQQFPLSDREIFAPGSEVRLLAGWGGQLEPIFAGIVVKHGLRIAGQNNAQLVVDCRDKALKMTTKRRNATYVGKSDSDIMTLLLKSHGLPATVAATTVTHRELVQHYCTDWDFLLSRAEAVGALVLVNDGSVDVKAPAVNGAAVLSVAYGESLIGFEADVDARHQYRSVKAQAWSPASQALVTGQEADPATLNEQGNLDQATLSGVLGLDSLLLQTTAPLTTDALKTWAAAQQIKSGLSRLRGRVRFVGSAQATVGSLIELAGVGERFNGEAFATAVTHEFDGVGGWTTEVEFGQAPTWFAERHDLVAPGAAGLVPAIEGLYVGKVVKLDGDPANEQRIQVRVPTAGVDSVWARLMQFHASNAFGALFVPEVDDEVVLGWFHNDPAHPVVLGSLYSSSRPPATALAAENNTKSIVTRCKSKIEFDEDKKVITVTTPGRNQVVLSDEGKSILLSDQNGNTVKLADGGITLDSPKDVKITAKGAITVEATGALTMKSAADVKIEGLNVNATASIGLTAKGTASAELSASGQTVVKGAMVMIN